MIWCIWCGIVIPHEPPQAAVLFNTKGLPASRRVWIEPEEWLNTKPSSSPRGATPTHAGRWGSAWRTPPDLPWGTYLVLSFEKGLNPKPFSL